MEPGLATIFVALAGAAVIGGLVPAIAHDKGYPIGPWVAVSIWCALVGPLVVILAAGALGVPPDHQGPPLLAAAIYLASVALVGLLPPRRRPPDHAAPAPLPGGPPRAPDRRARPCPRCHGMILPTDRGCVPCAAERARGERA